MILFVFILSSHPDKFNLPFYAKSDFEGLPLPESGIGFTINGFSFMMRIEGSTHRLSGHDHGIFAFSGFNNSLLLRQAALPGRAGRR